MGRKTIHVEWMDGKKETYSNVMMSETEKFLVIREVGTISGAVHSTTKIPYGAIRLIREEE